MPSASSLLEAQKKTAGLAVEFERLFSLTRPAFSQQRVFSKAHDMAISSLLALSRHTITGLITTYGGQFKDWSSAYRLFERERFEKDLLFAPVLSEVCSCLDSDDPVFGMIDDTIIRKCGRKICGTGWRRDPLGPAFHANFVWGQRFLQASIALPEPDGSGRARAIPVDFIHAPGTAKPKKDATPEQWQAYRQEQKRTKVSAVGAERLHKLREQIPDRKIVVAVDGGFTNSTVFKNVPDNTVLIGRIRKDARLFDTPTAEDTRRGRKRFYGAPLPTPEQIRQDDSIPWQQVEAYAAGKRHGFDIKAIPSVRWKGTGDKDVTLVVIRPLSYRKTANAKLLYRKPAYLLCTDTSLPLEQLLQAYLWRWEIELNFRDEKTVLGVGEAQVRTPAAVENVPALIVASYAFMLLASRLADAHKTRLPQPKWQQAKQTGRLSTQQMIALLRSEFWRLGIDSIKRDFVMSTAPIRSPFYSVYPSAIASTSLISAVCFAAN